MLPRALTCHPTVAVRGRGASIASTRSAALRGYAPGFKRQHGDRSEKPFGFCGFDLINHRRSLESSLRMQRLAMNAQTLALFVSVRNRCVLNTTESVPAPTALTYSSEDKE
jgi:hypothetical protein